MTTLASQKLRPTTVGGLRRTGYVYRTVRQEIRENLIRALRERRPIFPGIVGYEETVVPQVVRALLATHNILLLGQRGQAKTRLIRGLTALLDAAVPIIEDAPIPEDPFHPVTPTGRRQVEQNADDLRIVWLERADRYHEKLATPDVSIADLIGDIDPIKAMARKLDFASEEIIHYGIVPRANRGIFAINELPDLQPRIQVGLLNILEEKDFQIRGFPIRMQIDQMMVFTANPEDYTNRGNIITPLKDRIESQILTHYPQSIEDGVAIIKQEAWTDRNEHVRFHISDFFYELIEQIAVEARMSDYVDRGSGVSARMPITLLETMMSSMEQRALTAAETDAWARVADLFNALPAITGKIELVYKGEQEGVAQVAEHLVGRAVRERFNQMFVRGHHRGRDHKSRFEEFADAIAWFEAGNVLDLSDQMGQATYETTLEKIAGLKKIAAAHFPKIAPGASTTGDLAGFMEFMLEGLAQNFALSKFKLVTGTRYADELAAMQKDD
jgi:magnesium chelatase subunit I